MSNGKEYLIKFADFLDAKNCKEEANYIDKLLLFLNKKAAQDLMIQNKKASFVDSLIKIADHCDICNSNECADSMDKSIVKLKKMPNSYMAKPQMMKIHEMAEELSLNIHEGEPLEDWMESKIAQITSMLSAVYDHLKYEKGGYKAQAPKINLM